MTKSLFATMAVTILAASSIFAQDGAHIRVNVPFDFAAGGSSLPAGEYSVRLVYSPNSVRMQNADGKHSIIALAHGSRPARPVGPCLVFHRYGDRYFLSQVFTAGDQNGEELSRSHEEQEQIAAHHASKTVTVVASLR
jgi:hypothetical protein